jgi:hydrogenase expression/formation protein HypC
MCVAVPARITCIEGDRAEVDIGGVSQRISLQLVPEAQVNDYVLIHAGFAIHVIDEQEAQETLKLLEAMADGPDGGDGDRSEDERG